MDLNGGPLKPIISKKRWREGVKGKGKERGRDLNGGLLKPCTKS